MRYGLPYKGSKNSIAEWIIQNLPKAETFCDLFAGGGAVTHAALLSGKYQHFIMNDIDGRLPKLFIECAYGKHTVKTHPEWISREEFFKRKDADAYIALVWSFGNNGRDYLYAKDLEPFKRALHWCIFYGDLKPMQELGIALSDTDEKDIYQRYLWFKHQLETLKRKPQYSENLTRAIEIERLQSLQSLQSLEMDYRDVSIPDGALIYCDIPYYGTNCGKYDGFNHTDFYLWAEEQDNIFISEYWMPEQFICIAKINKIQLSAANGNSISAVERIFTNRRTYNNLPDETKQIIQTNTAEQLSLFDEVT